MPNKSLIFDRGGNPYEVDAEEVDNLLASGAYFLENSIFGMGQSMSKSIQGLVTVYMVGTGQAIKRRPVDARELVRSGICVFSLPEKEVSALGPSKSDPGDNGVNSSDISLPVLSDSSTKQEIISTLSRYGIQYRSTMEKADLLTLWDEFVLENGSQN